MTAKLETSSKSDGTLNVKLLGRWRTGHKTPLGMDIHTLLNISDTQRLQFDGRPLDGWDSSLVVFLSAVVERCSALAVDVSTWTSFPSAPSACYPCHALLRLTQMPAWYTATGHCWHDSVRRDCERPKR